MLADAYIAPLWADIETSRWDWELVHHFLSAAGVLTISTEKRAADAKSSTTFDDNRRACH